MSVIQIRELTYTYPGGDSPTLDHINLEIEQGDFLAVVGNNGCGKSTLCKALNGLIPHFISGTFSGDVIVDGENTKDVDVGVLARKVGYVYQDFENQIIRPTVLDDASYACLNYGMPAYKEQGIAALNQCGLEGKETDYIWQLSGGQTHLLALAGAVALGSDVLILDEPIAQLDPSHADRIYQVLQYLNEHLGKTIIVIEHHTEYIGDYCKHVLLLRDGKVMWKLPSHEALIRVEELQASNIFPPQVTVAGHLLKQEGTLPGDTVLPATLESGNRVFKNLYYIGGKRFGYPAQCTGEIAAEFQDVCISYRSVKGEPHWVFHSMNLELHRGEKIALIGSNGAGKSTLMKLLIGLIRPTSGLIRLHGTLLKDMKPEQLSREISLVYQNPEEMFIKDSIRGDISYAMKARNVTDWETKTEQLLSRFRLESLAERDGRLLSGGQMRRASLAIGIALNPGILLLDEPTANLDMATRKEIMQTLNDMKTITETVMIATHDMQLVCEWADRIIVLCQGQVVADGKRDDIFGDDGLTQMTGIRPPEIFAMGQLLDHRAFCYTVEEFLESFKEGGHGTDDE